MRQSRSIGCDEHASPDWSEEELCHTFTYVRGADSATKEHQPHEEPAAGEETIPNAKMHISRVGHISEVDIEVESCATFDSMSKQERGPLSVRRHVRLIQAGLLT